MTILQFTIAKSILSRLWWSWIFAWRRLFLLSLILKVVKQMCESKCLHCFTLTYRITVAVWRVSFDFEHFPRDSWPTLLRWKKNVLGLIFYENKHCLSVLFSRVTYVKGIRRVGNVSVEECESHWNTVVNFFPWLFSSYVLAVVCFYRCAHASFRISPLSICMSVCLHAI